MSEVEFEIRQGVALLTLSRGRANALAPSMRAALDEALTRAADTDAVQAVVLRGAGDVFSSGVDIAEYDAPLAAPWVGDLARRIEIFAKPVVACLHGAALGAGFEIALAAHARVARAGMRLAQPEVTLGLVPGGGATQRLPRLLGAQAALEIMLSGRAVAPEDPRLRRIFEEVTDTDPLDAALSVAGRLAGAGRWPRSCDADRGFSDPEGYQAALRAVADRLNPDNIAETEILRCVEAAQLLPFEQGLAFEATVFEERIASPTARAIRHVYAAERRALAHPGADGAKPRDLHRVALLGDEIQLAQLAVFCLDRGRTVTLTGPRAGALVARVAAILDAAVSHGRLKPAARDAALARLSEAEADRALPGADLVLEGRGAEIGATRPAAHTIWCVLDDVQQARNRATQLGSPVPTLRVYRPAHSATLTEIAAPPDTPKDVLASVLGCFAGPGRSVLSGPVRPGLLGHRMMAPGYRAALTLVAAGADPHDVDAAALSLGFARGLFRAIEAEGPAALRGLLEEIAEGPIGPAADVLDHLAQAEAHLFYAKGAGEAPRNPAAPGHLAEWRAARGGGPALPEGLSLVDALHAALVNGAARMIEQGEVVRASDLDLCAVRGYGFARSKGGPLLQADLRGLLPLVRVMKRLEPVSAPLWAPAPLVDEMVKYGRRFH